MKTNMKPKVFDDLPDLFSVSKYPQLAPMMPLTKLIYLAIHNYKKKDGVSENGMTSEISSLFYAKNGSADDLFNRMGQSPYTESRILH